MTDITDEQIRALIELAESGAPILDMAEAVGVSNYVASAVVRALRNMKATRWPGRDLRAH